ncbi:unnamed protein product [Urochloa humidicola]
MGSASNGPVESSAESSAPAAEAEEEAVPNNSPAAAATKGRGLRRWRRIRRGQEQQRDGAATAGGGVGGAGDEDSTQFNKRRLPLAAGAPKVRHEAPAAEAESSSASVESRFVPPARLGPGLRLLVASAGFSVGSGGAESDHSEDRSSKSSTAASALRGVPRHEHAFPFQRERDRLPRSRAAAALHGRNLRAARSRADRPRVSYSAAVSAEADNSRSSVESDLRSSNALKARQSVAGRNGVHKVSSDYCDHSDEQQPSEEVRSTGYCKENVSSVVGRSAHISADSGYAVDEASVGKGQNGRMHSGADCYNESTLLLLQRTQEALENEIEKIMAVGKELTDDFDAHDDEWSGSVYLEEPLEEVSDRIKHLESRLEEASALIKEKDLRIHKLEVTAIENTNTLVSQSELDQLYREKMEAEIYCTILTGAYQASVTLAEDQMALYEAQKSLSEDYKQLGLKLRHTENRAMVLEEMAEKLQVQCKVLSNSSEVLQLQTKASRVTLFCFVQVILLCIAIGTYLMRLSPSSSKVVPT